MCMVSAISQYGGTRIAPQTWTRDTFKEYQEILTRLADLDAKLGEPDCVDPEKDAWMLGVEARLKALES